MQKALGNLFRSIAEVVDNDATEDEDEDGVAVAVAIDYDAPAETTNTVETGISDSAVEDSIIGLIECSDFTHRKATTLAEKLGVSVERVKVVAEDSTDLFIYTQSATGETLVRLS